ncbi:MAG: hypothetical protein PHW74_13715 [Desulfobacca sp.]|nr:hypothetical protein [Desulfobacca sp.]
MKLYVISIRPKSGLGTPLKGDTLFGHFCWQAANDPGLLEGGLERQIAAYPESPFVVFSSAFPKLGDSLPQYAVKRPDLPLSVLFSHLEAERVARFEARKENKKQKWLLLNADLKLELTKMQYLTDSELGERAILEIAAHTRRQMRKLGESQFIISFAQPHNTISRLTQTTGPEDFAPYTQEIWHYYPGTELAIFTLIEEQVTDIERVCLGLQRIGQWGYGKDASIGQGRFQLTGYQELPLPKSEGANACYILGPAVPEPDTYRETYFVPFVRFGKHGDLLARSGNPFKNPVIMAEEGAVFLPRNPKVFDKPYLGRAVTGLSKSFPATVAQGYAFYLPFRLEG